MFSKSLGKRTLGQVVGSRQSRNRKEGRKISKKKTKSRNTNSRLDRQTGSGRYYISVTHKSKNWRRERKYS